MRRIFLHILFVLCINPLCAQHNGHGLIDGLYAFEFRLVESEDSIMEGSIRYILSDSNNILLASTSGDTLQMQEFDTYLNPISTFLMLKDGGMYIGEWMDFNHQQILPVEVRLNQREIPWTNKALRYSADFNAVINTALYQLPLSPTVSLGKYLEPMGKSELPFSSVQSVSSKDYYSPKGKIQIANRTPIEMVDIRLVQLQNKHFTMEAYLPEFGENFVDSLSEIFRVWHSELTIQSVPRMQSRFPPRYYAILDLDIWTEDWAIGSFEYVGPDRSGEGMTFIYNRKGDKFVTLEDVIKPEDLIKIQNELGDDHLGISINHFGPLLKSPFNSIEGRENKYLTWEALNSKPKKKISLN